MVAQHHGYKLGLYDTKSAKLSHNNVAIHFRYLLYNLEFLHHFRFTAKF